MDVGYLAAGTDCSQPAAPDIAAIQSRLREAADRTPAGTWVTGSGYVEYQLAERRHPVRADLDAAVPDRPAVLYHTSLHACVLNSAALREAGFADGQPDPPDGMLGRDDQGRLTGVLFEGPMFRVFAGRLATDLAAMDQAGRARVVRRAGQRLAVLGITAACDADMRCQTYAATVEDVLKTTVYVASSDRGDLVAAWGQVAGFFGEHDVPSTLLGVAVLGYPDQLVEIEAIAVIAAR